MIKENSKQNPDVREDREEKIRHHMENTIRNMNEAEKQIDATDDESIKQELQDSNQRREEALIDMRSEVLEEMINR